MLYYLTAAGLVLHAFFWGGGLALLVVPRAWRRFWWAFAPGLGLALQSACVWAGANLGWQGTDSYAWATELVPLVLLAAGLIRGGIGAGWRRLGALKSAAGAGALMLAAGWMLVWPMGQVSRGLTTSSLGSCDHADYAAGARVLREFSRDDRTGFLDLPEVTRVRSAETFFDYWLRMNHFTPAALVAHNGTIFGAEPRRLVSVTAAALAVLNIPLALFLARALVRLRGGPLLVVSALVGFSPLHAYAVHHGALGQLCAMLGIVHTTLALWGAARDAFGGRSAWRWLPLLVAGLWLLAGSYNFILVVALVPVGCLVLLEALRRADARALGRILLLLIVAVEIIAVFFWGRLEGLIERFDLFEEFSFGWSVPLSSPEIWLGLAGDTGLAGYPSGVRIVAALAIVALAIAGLVGLARRNPSAALAAFCLAAPIMAGWGLIAWESRVRAHASYDAYKLVAVFHPGLVAGLCCWAATIRPGRRARTLVAGGILAVLLAASLHASNQFRRRMAAPPLRVDRPLLELARLESDPRVGSVNLRIDEFWSRLWANALLLRLPQYFPVHTYEGRLNTPLRGEWDVFDRMLLALPVHDADYQVLNWRFHAVRVASPGRLQASFGPGWYPEEFLREERWRWSDGTGSIEITNLLGDPQPARLSLKVRLAQPGMLRVELGDRVLAEREVGSDPVNLEIDAVTVPRGTVQLRLHTDQPPVSPGGGDDRRLAVALYGFTLRSVGESR